MILYFANNDLDIIGSASTYSTGNYVVGDDTKKEDVDSGISTFECKIYYTKDFRDKVKKLVKTGNKILRYEAKEYNFKRKDNSSDDISDVVENVYTISGYEDYFTIIEAEEDRLDQTFYIYAESAGLDLLNNLVGQYSNTAKAYSVYVNATLSGTGFTLVDGVTDAQEKLLSISFDQDQTVVERLQSIASTFEYEFYFGFTVTGMSVTKKWIKFVKERGVDTEKIISINREISNIKIKESIANLATVLYPVGRDNITLYGYTHSDGDIHTDGLYVVSDSSISKWGRLTRKYSCDATTQADLYTEAVKELKKRIKEETNYDLDISDFPEDVVLGDRINVVDDAGELYLSGRVLTMETSIADQTRKVTLGEWKIKNAGISDKVLELAAEFREIAENRDFYTWIVYADDASGTNMSKSSEGKQYIGIAPNRPKEDFDISEVTASMFTWTRVAAEDGVSVVDVRTFYTSASSPPPTPPIPTGTVEQIIASVPTGWAAQPQSVVDTDDIYDLNRIVYSDATVQYSAIILDTSYATASEAKTIAESTLIYDHSYVINLNTKIATFTAHVYQGGVDIHENYPEGNFKWYRKSETDLVDEYLGYGYTIDIDTSESGYGVEIIGKFNPNEREAAALNVNRDFLKSVDDKKLLLRVNEETGESVRVRDLEYSTVIRSSDAVMVIGPEDEHLVTVQTLADAVDKHYVHTQSVVADTWNINHNLNKFPSISVVDSAESQVEGEVEYVDADNVTLRFCGAFSGKAYLN